MKRINYFVIGILLSLCIISCNDKNPKVLKQLDTSSIKFEDKVVVYSGEENVILVSGDIPEGVSVVYENNTLTDAGSVTATARFIVPEGYMAIDPMTAVLTVKKANFISGGGV